MAFASFLWDKSFYVKALEDKTLRKFSPLFSPSSDKVPSGKDFNINIIEKRYEAENLLMREISQGHTQAVEDLLSDINKSMIEELGDNPVRYAQNYLIVLNTVMRKAAENAAVHPIHIDRASSVFSKKIEQIKTWDAIVDLCREMAFCYCQLVNEHSLKGFSPTVQKVIA